MGKASTAITLTLIGSAAALVGYGALSPKRTIPNDDGVEYVNGQPTTRRSSGSSTYYHGRSSSYTGSSWSSSGSSHSSGFSSSSSHSSSGTSRGGFGSSGHASASS